MFMGTKQYKIQQTLIACKSEEIWKTGKLKNRFQDQKIVKIAIVSAKINN